MINWLQLSKFMFFFNFFNWYLYIQLDQKEQKQIKTFFVWFWWNFEFRCKNLWKIDCSYQNICFLSVFTDTDSDIDKKTYYNLVNSDIDWWLVNQ